MTQKNETSGDASFFIFTVIYTFYSIILCTYPDNIVSLWHQPNIIMHTKHLLTIASALALGITTASAVPAMPGLMHTFQPDGTPITITLHGDEHTSWATSADGFTLMRDTEGFWTVATAAADGTSRPSAARLAGGDAAKIAPAGVRPGIQFKPAKTASPQFKASTPTQLPSTFPSTGKCNMLMVLVNFSDTQTTYTQADFDAYMNRPNWGGIGSFRDFYLENSYGQLDITTTVSRWVQLKHPKSYYTDNVTAIIREALTQLVTEGSINMSDYDNNNDGILDGLAIIHQGPGQEATSDLDDIWSHSSGVNGVSVGGVIVGKYTIQPEVLGYSGRQSTIGVMCHEFGHNLGAPDFYDTNYGTNGEFPGTGRWDLMASGSWNGNSGDRPAGINMWQKIEFGWLQPTLLEADTRIDNLLPASAEPVAYRIDSSERGDYFILENRAAYGEFDKALPNSGLLIYHINEDRLGNTIWSNTINASYPQAIYTVCAGAGCDPTPDDPYSYGWSDDSCFPEYGFLGGKNTSFSDNTLPSAKSLNGARSYFAVENITRNDDLTISFDYIHGERAPIPTDLTAVYRQGQVTLKWQYPDEADVDIFTIYRNGTKIGTTPETSFEIDDSDANPGDMEIIYNVEATLNNGLVSRWSELALQIPQSLILDHSFSITDDGRLSLTWEPYDELNMLSDKPNVTTVGVQAPKVTTAIRVCRDELIPYIGYTVTDVLMSNLTAGDVGIKACVWEADPDMEPQLIAEADATGQIKYGQARYITLPEPILITGEKDLWFGGEYTADTKVSCVIDNRIHNPGRGDLCRIGDGEWQQLPGSEGNHYISAALTAPEEEDEENRSILYVDTPFSHATDLSIPIGFGIYRDDILLATTASRRFTTDVVADAMFGISSIYKGGNESVQYKFNVRTTGVATPTAVTPRISTADGTIRIDGWDGPVTIWHTSGLTIYTTKAYDGRPITVAPGIYIVRAGSTTARIRL